MATNKKSLQLLRGNSTNISDIELLSGQPLYDKTEKVLYIGAGDGTLGNSNIYVSGVKNPTVTIDNSDTTYKLRVEPGYGVKFNKLYLPSVSSGTTYTTGTSTTSGIKKIIASNGTTLYWEDANNHPHQYLHGGDTRAVVTKPKDYEREFNFIGLKNGSAINNPGGETGYSSLVGLSPWTDSSGGPAHELAFNSLGLFHRIGDKSSDTWSVWRRILTSNDFETSTSNIKMNNTVSVGTLSTVARADHVHPKDTSKFNVSGGTITGDVIINEDLNVAKTLTVNGVVLNYDTTTESLKFVFA